MCALPFRPGSFDVTVCADNSLPHLLTPSGLRTALASMHRLLRPGGLLLITTRPYDQIRKAKPRATLPRVSDTPAGRAITFQLWDRHDPATTRPLETSRVA
jgi:glycine/sarcosine N-methyltransferase